MAIDLPPSLQNALKAASRPGELSSGQPPSLSKLLQMTVGETLSAKILHVSKVNEQQRQQLLQQVMGGEQSKLTGSAASRTSGNNMSTNSELLALIKSAQLKLLSINVRGTPVVTYTDKAVRAGQEILLKLASPTRLTLVDKVPGNSKLPDFAPNNAGSLNRAAIQDAMRGVIPRQEPLHKLLAALVKLSQLPPAIRQSVVPDTIAQAAHRLTTQLRSPQQLSQPASLKSALQNSGVALESKLAQQLTATRIASSTNPQGKSATTINNAAPQSRMALSPSTRGAASNTSLTRNSAAMSSALTSTSKTTTKTADTSQASSPSTGPSQDLKAGLLQLLSHTSAATGKPVNGSLVSLQQALKSAGTQVGLAGLLAQTAGNTNNSLQLMQLLQQLQSNPNLSPRELSQRDLRNQLVQLLHQQLLAGLAKMQLQQLNSLTQQHNAPDQAQAPQSWFIELPIKFGSEVQSVEVRIDEEWVDEENEDADQGNKKVQLWEVRLSFELPDMGSLHAHLKIIEDTVSASIWAEQPGTLEKARQQLSDLKAHLQSSGVEVKELQCFKGQPPSKDIQLGYSLVDITT